MMKQLMKPLSSITEIYKKSSIWGKILFLVIIFLIIISFFKSIHSYKNKREGFEEKQGFEFKDGDKVYDDFYSNVYDHLVYNDVKDSYEIGQIISKTNPTSQSIVLDVGCGTGHHVAHLHSKGITNVTGIDNSRDMIAKAKENYPEYNFIQEDIMYANNFGPTSFTHILCLYFTIYYIKNKAQFFQKCIDLLMPGGYLVIHLVDRENFDPILPSANPLLLISPQRYANNRITSSNITFEDFKYNADFNLDPGKDSAVFTEKFQNRKNGKIFRKNEHKFYMESEDEIINMAQQVGFIIQGKIDMMETGYAHQYMYILVKPG